MPAERLDRKVTVILATDVAAYSKHVEQDESLTIKTYSEREAVLLKLIEDFRGRVFNTAGDSVLAEFASAVDAVECAAAFRSRWLRSTASQIPSVNWNSASASTWVMLFRKTATYSVMA